MIYGYARVSSSSQTLEEQIAALTAAGCDVVRSEKQSGRTASDRAELQTLLAFLRAGDALMVTRIDRLARSVLDLLKIVEELREKGATLQALHQAIDTGSPAGMAFLQMLRVFAEFERSSILDRQRAGIAAARAAGRKGGRKAVIPRGDVARLLGEHIGATEIARRLSIGVASVYRIMDELAKHRSEPV